MPGGTQGNGDYAVSSTEATCNTGEIALSGGVAWLREPAAPADDDAELPIVEATMLEGSIANGPEGFLAAGGNDTATDRTLIARVWCLGD